MNCGAATRIYVGLAYSRRDSSTKLDCALSHVFGTSIAVKIVASNRQKTYLIKSRAP